MNQETLLVLGAGSWGTALAIALARNNHKVMLWDIDTDLINDMQQHRENTRYIPNVKLPESLTLIKDYQPFIEQIQHVVIAVPCHALASVLQSFKSAGKKTFCLACKGFQPGTQDLNHLVVQTELPDSKVAVLSGPSFAKEVAQGLPTAITIASEDKTTAEFYMQSFHSETFRVYTQDDIVGVEVGGAVKNVMAIAAGIADGLGYGANTRAALITRGINEIIELGLALGAKRETFLGLSGFGDLILTCTDNQSRNRRFGLALATGKSKDEAVKEIGQAIEGLKTATEVNTLAKKYNIEMPISREVLAVIEGEKTPDLAVKTLLVREPKAEIY